MNAGLSNLVTLKKHLLGEALRASTEFNDVIAAIGLGIAGLLDSHCNRKFGYLAGATQIISGQREHYYLPRFPIVSVTSVETRYQQSDAWTAMSDQPFQLNNESGLIEFLWNISPAPGQIRITWTGGYWFDTSEDNTGVAPAGSTALPSEVQLAWLLVCNEVFQKRDNLGVGIADEPDKRSKVGQLTLPPLVQSLLYTFIRRIGS